MSGSGRQASGLDRRAFLGLGAGFVGLALAPGWLRGAARIHRSRIPVMGTVAELAVAEADEARAGAALRAAAIELRRVESLMTRFDPRSDVGRFNAAPVGTRVPVAPETAEVVRIARLWADATGGAFDPTLERLARIWDPGEVARPPTPEAIRLARADSGGWTSLETWSDGTQAWMLRGPGTALDLGAIAKGWGIDRAADRLAGMGVSSALINVGGDLAALGRAPDGRPWRVGVRDPRDPDGIVRTVDLADGSMATSGDYLRYFSHAGVRYAHILDPGLASPTRSGVHSVTVVAGRATHADAAATAAFVLGPAGAADRVPTQFFRVPASRPRIIHTA
jgi:thiamine biosynthesis lipoprotein